MDQGQENHSPGQDLNSCPKVVGTIPRLSSSFTKLNWTSPSAAQKPNASPVCSSMISSTAHKKQEQGRVPLLRNLHSSYTTTMSNSPTIQYVLSQSADNEERKFLHNQWDELGAEGADHAKIWHLYNDESSKLDAATLDGCNRGIDVLLVFTGLFSAVLTTFIIQSYQQMMPDPSDTTNLLLLQLVSDLRSSNLLNITKTPIDLSTTNSDDVPSLTQLRWVNGLWFAALAFSLSAALISMLAKQWIQPIPNVSSSPRQRARERQRWYMQLQKWQVFVVINALPLLLHIALILFFAGVLVLLWSGNIAIVAATFTIVALTYMFYLGSMWMSLVDPNCPFQHPISEQLRHWRRQANALRQPIDLENTVDKNFRPTRISMTCADVNQDDYIDASCISWLLQHSSDDDTMKTALQAIGGLPRAFSAFQVLREANTIQMVLQQFNFCFRRDPSFGMHHCTVSDPEHAEKYCRAWIRLTHGTSESWPRHLREPLVILKDFDDNLHVAAIATCTHALDALIYRGPQLALLSHLDRFANGETSYDDFTESWLLETFLECSLSWELHTLVTNDIVKKAVPILLRLLQRATDGSSLHNRTTITLILHTMILGNVDTRLLWDEEQRSISYHNVLIPSLAAIIQHREHYGIDGQLLDFTVSEFSRLAAPAAVRASHFPTNIKSIARQGLSDLYLSGRIGVGLLSDSVLADMLQLLYPPTNVNVEQRPVFVKSLLKTLSDSKDINVATCSIRLLEPLLLDSSSLILQAFEDGDGISTLLRAALTGESDSRRLQFDCIRTLCIFLQRSFEPQPNDFIWTHSSRRERQLNAIFQSDFFSIVVSTIGGRKWWLSEVAQIWLPSLLVLCQIRPQEDVWKTVESAFRAFAEENIEEDGCDQLLAGLDRMKRLIQSHNPNDYAFAQENFDDN